MMQVGIPKGWASAELRDVAELERDSIQPADISSGTKYVGLEHIVSDGTFLNVTSVDEGELASSKFSFGPDHLLYGKLRPYLRKIIRPDFQGVCSTDILPIKPSPKIDKDYLFHYLRLPSMVKLATNRCSGANLPRLSPQTLLDFTVIFPPLPEQKRIAAILDKADSIRRKRQETARLTEELLRSAFLEMFGDPVENAKKWYLVPIGLAIKAIETGWSANSEDRPREKDEWAVLKISSVTSGRFLPGEYKVVADCQVDRELLTPKRGDLLFSRANTRELVAATCLVEQDEPKLFLPDKLWKIIPNEEITCSAYLRYLLAHPRFREKLTKQATGTSGSMLNISQAKVRGIEMPVPPIKLQKQFGDFVWRSYNIRNKLEAASQSSNTLFNSLLQRAFKGAM